MDSIQFHQFIAKADLKPFFFFLFFIFKWKEFMQKKEEVFYISFPLELAVWLKEVEFIYICAFLPPLPMSATSYINC